jgi:peptide/nickel transport system permease protein
LQTDTNVVMASLVLSATLLVVGNVLADLLLTVVDPRISLSAIEQRG